MGEVLYAFGYGIIEGTHKERCDKFVKRLEDIQRGIGRTVAIVDIRKFGCGSRNGKWCSWKGMNQTMKKMGDDFAHYTLTYADFANEFGGTAKGLREYRRKFERCRDKRLKWGGVAWSVDLFKFDVGTHPEWAYILMCGCREAFKKNGTTWNCHRVPLAEALVKELGEEWDIVNL